MTLVLDAEGQRRGRPGSPLIELRRSGLWPAQVPAVVLAQALTGDHRDFHANRLLGTCQIRDVTEPCPPSSTAANRRRPGPQ